MDLYELLGLARGATLIEIKRSYRRLARKYHPDINPGDNTAEAHFREITRAYETLADPELRVRYDAAGSTAEGSTTVRVEFEGFDFSGGQAQASSTFGDLFAEIFTCRREWRTDPAFACRRKGTRVRLGRAPAIYTLPCRWRRTRCSTATATTFTWLSRWRCTKRRSAPKLTCRRLTGTRGFAFRPARS